MRREPPKPGQESVWDYPRPPRLEAVTKRIRVVFGGETIADSRNCFRVLETSHPPVYYIPPTDTRVEFLLPTSRRSFCEFKGAARYWSLQGPSGRESLDAAWSYPEPAARFAMIQDHYAFYPARVDQCYVDDILVAAQPGGFYGGWITPDVGGPFKGSPGTSSW